MSLSAYCRFRYFPNRPPFPITLLLFFFGFPSDLWQISSFLFVFSPFDRLRNPVLFPIFLLEFGPKDLLLLLELLL